MRLLLTFFLLFTSPICAETRQHGNLIFVVPKGWVSGGSDDGILTLRSELPDDECEFCAIRVTAGSVTGGRVDTWLDQQTRRFIDPDETDPPKITQIVAPEVFNLKGRPGAILGQTVDGELQVLFAVQLFGRMELIAFTAPASDMEDIPSAMTVFQRDVVPLLEGARFVSEGAAPLMPPPVPGEMQGVWWGTTNWWLLGIDGMMTMQIDYHWLTLYPDGTFYDGTPPTGTAPFDRAERLALGDMDWGSYSQDGATLTLHYASGEVESYQVTDDTFQKGDRRIDPIDLLADGTKINGTVSTIFVSGFTPGIGMSGGVTRMTDTTYHPDGTWDYGAYAGASATFENGSGFATGSDRSESGRYLVKDGLVTLFAEDGSFVWSDYIFKAGDTIWIGSEILK
ncbi:hypothetical protein [Tabrizicola aquatica]|uniref:hypothetical protein n=1 Tax=Tabrizicola aquatica TaxID=909926 RepID=UPI000CD0F1DE|nr:hypothetical protein [Tabrizicola aquatica]